MKKIFLTPYKKKIFEIFKMDLLEHVKNGFPLRYFPHSEERRAAFKKLQEAILSFKIVIAKADLQGCEEEDNE